MAKKLTKEAAQKFLSDVALDKYFYIYNGPIVKNIIELADVLDNITDEQFRYHRNNGKNDFYSWVKLVVLDNRLANEVARAKTLKTMQKKVKQRIDYLKSIAK